MSEKKPLNPEVEKLMLAIEEKLSEDDFSRKASENAEIKIADLYESKDYDVKYTQVLHETLIETYLEETKEMFSKEAIDGTVKFMSSFGEDENLDIETYGALKLLGKHRALLDENLETLNLEKNTVLPSEERKNLFNDIHIATINKLRGVPLSPEKEEIIRDFINQRIQETEEQALMEKIMQMMKE